MAHSPALDVPPAASAAVERFLRALIDQERARVIVAPKQSADGFWFGGGNLVEHDGALYLVGRYRNFGDSRTGIHAGERGLELALFRSTDRGATFEHVRTFNKSALSHDGLRVLSIEGSCLVRRGGGFSLFVSTEKDIPYPQELEAFSKPGTGVWSIDELSGPDPESIDPGTIREICRSDDPAYLHVKDPFWHGATDGGDDTGGTLLFCTHPFNWSSSNTGYVVENKDGLDTPVYKFFDRGTTWDVAITRGTCILPLPRVGVFADVEPLSVLLYDGGECLRQHDQHEAGVSRPRGYSCEEIGGAALIDPEHFDRVQRLSRLGPLFVSPTGTGSSRYADVLVTGDGYYATWQQSQSDKSQPLVMSFLSHERAAALLSGDTTASENGFE